jgi:membrane associated rhomboid family serine protease
MFILGDESHHNGRFPWVTVGLVVANVLMFGLQIILGEPFTNGFSLVPKEITEFRDITQKQRVKVKVEDYYYDHRGHPRSIVKDEYFTINHYPGPFPIVLTLVTSMFLHGGVMHLIGNMWFLLVFGRNVECALGHGRFLIFYLLCGVVGGLMHVASDPHSVIPCLGASGAISGVMGAYVAIHPLNKIKCWFGWWFGVIELPALVVIGFWFLLQYLSAFITWDHPEWSDGIAYWDHLGGFLTGVAFIWGTVLYLRWQLARSEEAGADAAPESAAAPAAGGARAEQPAPDPFASFLPPTAIRAGEPKQGPTSAPAPDPFASFLPPTKG